MDWEEASRILGVGPAASTEEIREQYHYKAQLLHPDMTVGRPESIRRKAADEFKSVNQAYHFLTDPLNNPFTNPPRLRVSPRHIRFVDVDIGQKKATSFEISSIGGAYTSIWFEREPSPWLSVTSFRSTTTEQLPMEVTIECTGAGEHGKQYSCKLPVRLENAKTKLKDEVVLDIELWTRAKTPIGQEIEILRETQLPHTDAFKIREWLCREFQQKYGIDLRHEDTAMQQLLEAGEKARVDLHRARETEISLPFVTRDAPGPKHLDITLARSKLKEISRIVLDTTPLTLGIELPEGVMRPLIPRNTPIPVFKYLTMRTAGDYQTTAQIHVLQGERPLAADNRTLARFIVRGITPAPKGGSGFLVHFDIDANGILGIWSSGQHQERKIIITASGGVCKDEADKMSREAEQHTTRDAALRERLKLMKDAKCPACRSRHTLRFNADMQFWRCRKCNRIFTYEELLKARTKGKHP